MRSIEINPELTTEEQVGALVEATKQIEEAKQTEIVVAFSDFVAKAHAWRDKAMALEITSEDQKSEMKLAREMRLALKNIRVQADKTRKKLKEEALLYSNAVQGAYNVLINIIMPAEEHLEQQEKFVALQAEKRRREQHEARVAELHPYWEFVPVNADFGNMTEEDYQIILNGAKLQAAEKERLEEHRRKAQEKADAEARLDRARRNESAPLISFMPDARSINFGALTEKEYASLVRAAKAAKKKRDDELAAARAAAEKAQQEKAEANRKAEEERQARLAAERKAQEERDRLARELADKQAAERKAKEEEERKAAALAAAPDIQKLETVAQEIIDFSSALLMKYTFATDQHRNTFEGALKLLARTSEYILEKAK